MEENNTFAPCYSEIKFSKKVRNALKRLEDGKSIRKSYYSSKELNDIGLCFWYGHIVSKDYRSAIYWYDVSAQMNYEVAEFNLYVCYNRGTGVAANEKIALAWLRRAAKHGCPNAQLILAECYYKGEMVKQNCRLADLWLRRTSLNAIKQGDEITLFLLGIFYSLGECVSIDMEKAIFYYQKAGELKYPLAINHLIWIFIACEDMEKVEYWMKEFYKCKGITSSLKERTEQNYYQFKNRIDLDVDTK